MNSFFTYLKNVRGELSHVVWPGRSQAILHTVLIVVISALVALLLAGFDYVFTGVVNQFISY
ncbi:MAG TPA: preprotein translocase subunit SecE [Candidatus Paceibacterota bacterium]|nr:preprotein translocase subunit SecE [Candidatus Paceibacterota bacterium]